MSVLANMSLLATTDSPASFRLQNITDVDGYAIAITGMVIVFFALTLISVFLTLLPRILERVNTVFPEPAPQVAAPPVARVSSGDEEIAAAIGVALHRHHGGG